MLVQPNPHTECMNTFTQGQIFILSNQSKLLIVAGVTANQFTTANQFGAAYMGKCHCK